MPAQTPGRSPKLLLFANTAWYLYNFRLPLARAARARGADVVFVSPPGAYGKELEAAGFRWIPVPMSRRGSNPLRELNAVLGLVRLYRGERPDLVHHFTLKSIVFGGVAAKLTGVSGRVSAVTGMGFVYGSDALLARVLRPFIRLLLRMGMSGAGSRVIVQNPDDARAIVDGNLADASRVRLIKGSGVDTSRFRPAGTESVADGAPVRFLFAARLLYDKGIADFVEAGRILRCAGLPVQLVVAGEPDAGNPASVSEGELAAWRSEGIVEFLGHVRDLDQVMARMTAVVLPSRYREGVPRSLIEAAAAGLPIVTTDTPGCREIVEHGSNGLLVPPRDVQALAGAMRMLAENRALASEMGARGRAKVLAEFDERSVIERTLCVYGELLPEWGIWAGPTYGEFGSAFDSSSTSVRRSAA